MRAKNKQLDTNILIKGEEKKKGLGKRHAPTTSIPPPEEGKGWKPPQTTPPGTGS